MAVAKVTCFLGESEQLVAAQIFLSELDCSDSALERLFQNY